MNLLCDLILLELLRLRCSIAPPYNVCNVPLFYQRRTLVCACWHEINVVTSPEALELKNDNSSQSNEYDWGVVVDTGSKECDNHSLFEPSYERWATTLKDGRRVRSSVNVGQHSPRQQ